MMNAMLLWLTRGLRVRVIDVGGRPYLERYIVRQARSRRWWSWSVYLHRYVRCDGERWLHDHPWRLAVSFVLSGGYWEQRWEYFDPMAGMVTCLRPVRWWNVLSAKSFHRIDRIAPNTWTLFLVAPRFKGWGFLDVGADQDVHVDSPCKVFFYEQPYAGSTESMYAALPTGEVYRETQDVERLINQGVSDYANDGRDGL